MANIPQFESNVPIQPAPIISSAPVWDAVSQTATKMMGIVGSEVERANAIALQANKYESAGQIAHQSLRAYNDAAKNSDVQQGMAEFNRSMDGIAKGILGQTAERNLPYIKRMLTYHTDRYNQQFLRREAQQSQSLAYNKFTSVYDTLTNEMSNAAYNGDQHSALVFHGQLTNMVNDGIKNGFLDASRAALFSKNLESEFRQGTTLGQYRAARAEGLDTAGKFKKNFMTGKIEGSYNQWFDHADKEQMLNQFNKVDKQFANENGINSATYDMYKKQVIFNAQNGQKINQGVVADLIATAPKKALVLMNDIRNAEQQYQIVSSTKDGTLADIQTKINDLQNPKEMPTNVNEAQNNLKAATQLKSYLKDLQNDPVHMLSQNPAYQEKLQEVTTKGNLTRSQLNIAMQRHMGFDDNQIHALDNNTAQQAVEAIKGLPLQDQVKSFDDFLSAHPPSSRPFIIKDLQRAGLPLSSQYLYRISKAIDPTVQNMTTPAAIAWSHIQITNGVPNYTKALGDYNSVLQAQKVSTADLKTAVTTDDTFSNYANVFMSQGGDIANALANYTNHAELLTLQLMAQGEDKTTAAANANQAMTAGLEFDTYKGNAIAYDSTIDHALLFGHRFLGKQYSPGVLDYLLNKSQKEGVDVPRGFKALFPTLPPKALQEKYLDGASFVTLPDQSGLILQDANQFPVKLSKDKSSVIASWTDLKDHNSKLMNDFTKQKSEWGFLRKELAGLNPRHLGFLDIAKLHRELFE